MRTTPGKLSNVKLEGDKVKPACLQACERLCHRFGKDGHEGSNCSVQVQLAKNVLVEWFKLSKIILK